MMNLLWLRLAAGGAVIALVAGLALALEANGAKAREIRDLKADLAAASTALTQAARDIERFSVKESAIAAEAARLCAVEGDNAFGRGVEVGMAVCESRR